MHHRPDCSGLPVNLTGKQRIISTVAGTALLALGIFDIHKSALRKAIRLSAGGILLMRGISGYCPATAWKAGRERKKMDEPDEDLARENERNATV